MKADRSMLTSLKLFLWVYVSTLNTTRLARVCLQTSLKALVCLNKIFALPALENGGVLEAQHGQDILVDVETTADYHGE